MSHTGAARAAMPESAEVRTLRVAANDNAAENAGCMINYTIDDDGADVAQLYRPELYERLRNREVVRDGHTISKHTAIETLEREIAICARHSGALNWKADHEPWDTYKDVFTGALYQWEDEEDADDDYEDDDADDDFDGSYGPCEDDAESFYRFAA